MNRFGSRPIILFGGCLAGSGLVAASFCNTVQQLYFFIGVVGGEFTVQQPGSRPARERRRRRRSDFLETMMLCLYATMLAS